LNIQKQGTAEWPLKLNLVNVFDSSLSDFDGDFGKRLGDAYQEIVAREAIHDSIESVRSPIDIAQVRIDSPSKVDFEAIATSLDMVARITADLHSDIAGTVDDWT